MRSGCCRSNPDASRQAKLLRLNQPLRRRRWRMMMIFVVDVASSWSILYSLSIIYVCIYIFSYIYILWMHSKGISFLTSLGGDFFLFGCVRYENRNLSRWNLDSCNENFFDVSHLQELVTHFIGTSERSSYVTYTVRQLYDISTLCSS